MTKRTAASSKRAQGTDWLDLSNETIRKLIKGIDLMLKERLPREPGLEMQVRRQALKFALAPVEAEYDRLVMLYVKRDRKKRPVMADNNGYVIDERKVQQFNDETKALWATKQRVRVAKLKRSTIPERVEGRAFIVEGIAWDLLAPILTD